MFSENKHDDDDDDGSLPSVGLAGGGGGEVGGLVSATDALMVCRRELCARTAR